MDKIVTISSAFVIAAGLYGAGKGLYAQSQTGRLHTMCHNNTLVKVIVKRDLRLIGIKIIPLNSTRLLCAIESLMPEHKKNIKKSRPRF